MARFMSGLHARRKGVEMYDEVFAFTESVRTRFRHDDTWAKFMLAMAERTNEAQNFSKDSTMDTATRLTAAILYGLEDAKLYFVGKEAHDLIVAGKDSMVDILKDAYEKKKKEAEEGESDGFEMTGGVISYWDNESFPGPGLVYFDKDARSRFHVNTESHGELEGTIRAVQWTERKTYYEGEGAADGDCWILVILYADIPKAHDTGLPLAMYAWGKGLDHCTAISSGQVTVEPSTFLSSFWAFIQQKIFVMESSIPPKPFRKRADREGRKVDPIQIVHLRKREYLHGPRLVEGEAEAVDWANRWIVDAHWHRYHTKDGMVRKWLLPYVKGPEDKPLVVKDKKLFAVVR